VVISEAVVVGMMLRERGEIGFQAENEVFFAGVMLCEISQLFFVLKWGLCQPWHRARPDKTRCLVPSF
jgi:hypothetical protein